ncbi:MAG: hypothetical protein WBO12_00960 [Xanthobacteraceae bacterium]
MAGEAPRIEERISFSVARQLLLHPAGQCRARKPERQGLVIFERGGDQFGKADGLQHGFGGKEPHPDLEYLWIDLERIVEAAKYDGVLRQAAFGPTGQTVGDGTLVVIGLVNYTAATPRVRRRNGNAKKPLRSGQPKRRGKSNAILVPPLGPNLGQIV